MFIDPNFQCELADRITKKMKVQRKKTRYIPKNLIRNSLIQTSTGCLERLREIIPFSYKCVFVQMRTNFISKIIFFGKKDSYTYMRADCQTFLFSLLILFSIANLRICDKQSKSTTTTRISAANNDALCMLKLYEISLIAQN